MKSTDGRLPPNPYTLQPVRKRESLAGRTEELRKCEYYLSLLSQGQSHHLALIGNRGTGKTSLLNATESIARDFNLLPVRVDLNEQKAKAPGPFWMEVYAALLVQLGRLGCWGGAQGEIYAALFTMIHARKAVSLDKVVLHFPYAAATYQGDLEKMFCSDSLLLNDLEALQQELSRHSVRGIVLLIDEADCLGANLPLIQMFRNVFQRNQFSCVVLAGTEAVFPTLSEVFSPIPRQFHRISVQPFAHRNQTLELIIKPLESSDASRVAAPDRETINELHELCAGDPAELQLYCHHMYRLLEHQQSIRKTDSEMSLSPAVFREILKEYRASAPSNADGVLNAIEALPDDVLYKTGWLKRRKLSIDENTTLRILHQELKTGTLLEPTARTTIRKDTEAKYDQLYSAGVTVSRDCLTLKASPLSAGFWKSLVATEKDASWYWDDSSYESARDNLLTVCIAQETMAKATRLGTEDGDFADTLAALRRNQPFGDVFSAEVHFFAFLVQSSEEECGPTKIVEATVAFGSDGRHAQRKFSYGDASVDVIQKRIEQCIQGRREVLAAHDIDVALIRVVAFDFPTRDELHRLAYVAGVYLPEEHFGPSVQMMAIEYHNAGQHEKAAELFLGLLKDRDSMQIRNNAAYCLTIAGKYSEALNLFESAETTREQNSALWIHNLGVLKHLTGDTEGGTTLLRKAFDAALTQEKDDLTAYCMMILTRDLIGVSSVNEMPIDAGILINLSLVGQMKRNSVLESLSERYPDKAKNWESLLPIGD